MRSLAENLTRILRKAENPARYTGGEFGITVKDSAALRCAVSYPDLYEIGMSNKAVAILYGMLNSIPDVSCERVFCPAEDFETLLKKAGIPLYGLETGRPLSAFDILAFTVGHELTAVNILTILASGGVPLLSSGRGPRDPIVIAGGPAVTNPLPFSAIFDAVYIGEAEAEFRLVAGDLAVMKKSGARREDLLSRIRASVSFWYPRRPEPAKRSLWMGFPDSLSCGLSGPVPSLRTVQDHGTVEIMRGCPHGCRFCHAGVYYKPFRMKNRENIYEEVYNLIHKQGYREITLSSLSSGDYTDISGLVNHLTARYQHEKASFSLPSLHLESLGLSVLREISAIRKSGLTFAVETPLPELQKSLNKQASREKIIALLREAKRNGWKLAKFYFMVGLPVYSDPGEEARDIIDFVRSVHAETRINLNINIGTFIPKPHTPYQRAPQLCETKALDSIMSIKRGLASGFIKVGYHAPFQSCLEGVFSRGGEQTGELLFEAWKKGARFDAWEDRSRPEVWREVLEKTNALAEALRGRRPDEDLPWEKAVSLGTSAAYQAAEWNRHTRRELTPPCGSECPHPCGVCNAAVYPLTSLPRPETPGAEQKTPLANEEAAPPQTQTGGKRLIRRCVCRYEKTGSAAFLPHLSILQVMERTLLRAGIALRFTEGFNPKPVLEFAQPSSVGAESLDEVFSFETFAAEPAREEIPAALNAKLPEGLRIKSAADTFYRETEKKPASLMSLYEGGRYELRAANAEILNEIAAAFRRNPAASLLEDTCRRAENTLVLDYRAEANGKGFAAALKALTPEEAPPDIRVRKLLTYLKD